MSTRAPTFLRPAEIAVSYAVTENRKAERGPGSHPDNGKRTSNPGAC
jgi:hypothetical protein